MCSALYNLCVLMALHVVRAGRDGAHATPVQAVPKPTPQAEERLAEATLAVAMPPAAAADMHSAPAANGAVLVPNGDMHVPVTDAAAEVAAPQEPALKVRLSVYHHVSFTRSVKWTRNGRCVHRRL